MAEQVKIISTEKAQPASGGSEKPPSLIDSIDTSKTAGAAPTPSDNNKNKTTEMKSEGVKPITALGPILSILGITIALVLWRVSPTAALIVGLVAVAVFVLWWLHRKSKNKKAPQHRRRHNSRSNPYNSPGRSRPRSWLSNWRGRSRGRGGNQRVGGSPGSHSSGSQGRRNPWWKRGSRNPLNRDHRNSPSRSARSQHRDGPGDTSSRKRSPWWKRNRDNSSNRNRHTGDSVSPSSNSRRNRKDRPQHRGVWPFNRNARTRNHPSNGSSHTPNSRRGGSSSVGHTSPNSRGRRGGSRYKPWTWGGKGNNSHTNGGRSGHSGPGGNGTGSSNGNSKGRRRRMGRLFHNLWDRRLYDEDTESVNGYHNPNRRNKFRDHWQAWRTNRQRQDTNYVGFEVGGDGTAKPHRDQGRGRWRHRQEWRMPWTQHRHNDGNRETVYAESTRMDSPYHDSGHSSPSLGTQHNIPVLPTSKGSQTMASQENNGPVANAVGGRVEAATYAAGATNASRSSLWHIAVSNQLRSWAYRLINSDNPFHRATAHNYLRQAARANEVAENDARLAAIQMSESQRALNGGNGTQSIGGDNS